MNVKDKLQIYIITYNRKKKLKCTLDSILSKTSPIRDFDITILDNASTDGTSELIDSYCKEYENLKHIRHNINIGGNANICRAFEMGASCGKDYFWVLCDDDFYSWTGWSEIERAMCLGEYDMLFTCTRLIRDKGDIAQFIHQATFVPGVIYAAKCVTDEVMQNMYNTINTMFCQTMVSSGVICHNIEKVFVPQNDVVMRIPSGDESDDTIIRGRIKSDVHPDTKNMFWHIGFIQAIQVVKDKKKRDYIIEQVRFTDIFTQTFFDYMLFIVDYNHRYKDKSLKNLFDLFFYINLRQKVVFLLATIFYYSLYVHKSHKSWFIRLFGILEIEIYSSKWLQFILSIKNSKDKKYKVITILGLKIKLKRKTKKF